MLKLSIILFIITTLVVQGYAAPSLTEIKPQGSEFVEIVSHSTFNFSNIKIYDSNGRDSYNTVKNIQSSNSSFTLIVGEAFVEKVNVSNLNCSIYLTSGRQVSKGGLLKAGETLQINDSSFSLNWSPNKEYSLTSSQSIDPQFRKSIVSSPCEFNKIPKGERKDKGVQFEDMLTCSCPSFSISTRKKITNNTFEYEFNTNANNPIIEYWVESFNGSVVKEKINTSSTSTKYFTPAQMDVYTIKANLYSSKCTRFAKKEVIYQQEPKSLSYDSFNSSIKIENAEELKNSNQEEILYELSRGNTSKRVVKFYLGDNELASLYLKKFSSISGRITLPEYSDSTIVTIRGLSINKSISLYEETKNSLYSNSASSSSSSSSSSVTSQKKPSKQMSLTNTQKKLEISLLNISQNNFYLNFSINSTHNADILCYIINDMTQLSSVMSAKQNTTFRKYSITINKTKMLNQNKTHNNELFCKYKKQELKTFNSLRESIDIEFNSNKTKNTTTIATAQNITTYFQESFNSSSKSSNTISSQQIAWKEYSLYGIIGVVLLVVSFLVVFWQY